jgi:predicted glutamine amidotransferase
MCDLFALSAGRNYSAPKALPIFAVRGGRNMDGWGIGCFKKHGALVEKSAQSVYVAGRVHDSFQRLARVVSGRIIISHVRFRSSGPIDECHAHPFILHFAGHDWIFAHNGKAPLIESYVSPGVRLDEAVSDSARTFEYLRDGLTATERTATATCALFCLLKETTAQLVRDYPGNYNYLLSNGVVLFAFTNHRQWMLLKGSRNLEKGLLLTTLERGLSGERWVRVARKQDSLGELLAIVGTDIVLQESLY